MDISQIQALDDLRNALASVLCTPDGSAAVLKELCLGRDRGVNGPRSILLPIYCLLDTNDAKVINSLAALAVAYNFTLTGRPLTAGCIDKILCQAMRSIDPKHPLQMNSSTFAYKNGHRRQREGFRDAVNGGQVSTHLQLSMR